MILVLHQDFFPILLNPVLRLHDKILAYMYDISTMGAIYQVILSINFEFLQYFLT